MHIAYGTLHTEHRWVRLHHIDLFAAISSDEVENPNRKSSSAMQMCFMENKDVFLCVCFCVCGSKFVQNETETYNNEQVNSIQLYDKRGCNMEHRAQWAEAKSCWCCFFLSVPYKLAHYICLSRCLVFSVSLE